MKNPDAWARLAAAARRLPPEADTSAPYGFATRVAALGLAAPAERLSLFAPLSLGLSVRALAAACLLAVTTAGFSYSELVKFSDGTVAAPAHAQETPAVVPVPAKSAPVSTEAPAANASSDDPVSDLMNLVS